LIAPELSVESLLSCRSFLHRAKSYLKRNFARNQEPFSANFRVFQGISKVFLQKAR